VAVIAAAPRGWAVFLDRDGTLNRHVIRDGRRGSPWRLDDLSLVEDAVSAAARLRRAGARLFVVTNQPDVERGFLRRDELNKMHALLADVLGVSAAYVCPHTAERRCRCRKPASRLLHLAADDFAVRLPESFVVGDRATDAQAGLNAGLTAVLLTTSARPSTVPAMSYATTLTSAVTLILRKRDQASATLIERNLEWNSAQ